MGALKNHRRELFCQTIMSGKSKQQAAITAGYSANLSNTYGQRLANKRDVQIRLKELNEAATSERIMSVIERKELLTLIARACISDFITIKNGKPEIKLDSLSNPAIQNANIKTRPAKKGGEPVTTIDINLHDRLKAVAELNRMDGLGVWKGNLNIETAIVPMKVIEVRLNAPDSLPPD